MRQDLDRLMRERGLAGLVVFAHDRYSPAMYYVTGQKIHYGIYFKAAGGQSLLVHDPMERDQAALAGGPHTSFAELGLNRMVESEGHPARAFGRLIAERCAALGMKGPVSFFGDTAIGFAHTVVARALEVQPGLAVDQSHPDILTIARTTKDADEIAAIRKASQGATAAIETLRKYLAGLKRQGETFRANGSSVVKLGDIRRLIREEFLAHDLSENAGESIVSQGRDAGVPHNRGNDAEPLRAGAPLLIDIFPGEAGGGYHSDLTRTFCLGKAPEPLNKLYSDVEAVFQDAMSSLAVGEPCRAMQERVCDQFERRGHVTVRKDEKTQEGYVHGLGHGVGLAVHEAPRLGGPPSNTQTIEPGMVITVEPGLYYPSRGMGVRIEDLVLVRPDGSFENLTPAPYDLEIETHG